MGKLYKPLSSEERRMIQLQLSQGYKSAEIARELGRSAGTVSHELQRNGWTRPEAPRRTGRPLLSGGYKAEAAQRRAHLCSVEPRSPRKLRPETALWRQIKKYLHSGYSPEIAGTLATVHPATPSFQVSHETIYTAIYAMPRGELRTEVRRCQCGLGGEWVWEGAQPH